MSSPEEIDDQQTEHDAQPGPQIKKRRVQTARACDRCRLKKIRCDGSPDPGAKCSHCAMSDSICVFTTGVKQKRAPAKKYVDGLETRLERLEALLSRLHPDSDFSHELDGDPPSSASQIHSPQGSISSSHRFEGSSKLPHALFDETHDIDTHDEQFVPSPEAVDSGSEEEELITDHVNVIRKLREMNITSPLNRYYGRSSSVRLYATAFNMKSEVSGLEQNILQEVLDNAEKRPDFWKLHPWERTRFSHQQKTSFIFPDPDLMVQLVHTYFSLFHFLMPILHRPTFEASFAEGAHFRDEGFGTIVLLVCAVGARFVDDSRVFLDDPEKPGHPHSAGWKWFNQVQLVGNAALSDPTLTDLQSIALSILFLSGSSPPQASWTLAGIGIRLAQDVGVHRRKTFADKSFEGELWKRSFWALVGLDVTYSSFLGRPCAIALDSFDVDFPIDCDDEYWAPIDPSMTFKQPPGKPSSVAFMIFWIKLQLIHSHALRTIYSLEKHKVIAKIGEQEWEKRVVSELDSALNRWFDALPDHLRWDPSRPNEVHFFQTVALHASYHHVQMTIHRPFIPSTRKVSSLSFPSFTICANSARACIHVLQAHERRLPRVMIMNLLIPAFLSGIVLVLRVWVAKRSGMKIDAEKDLKDVRHAIQFISAGEIRWPLAGRFKDLLSTLVKVGEIPLPMASPTMKRSRDSENETASRSSAPSSATFPPTSGLASTSRRSSTGLTEFAQPPTSSNSISTFGPPVGPHESNQSPLFGSNVPHNNSNLSSPLHPAYSGDTIRSQQTFNHSSVLPAKPSNQASDRSAGVSNAAFQSQTPYQPIQDLYTLLNGPEQSPMMPFDTPTPPSSETSPAATLGLGTDLYGQYTGLPVSFGPDMGMSSQVGSSSSSRGPASMSAADNFLNFLAPMVPQDGQMDVSDDMVAMWSTLPTNFQSEDWENYMSNMMNLSGNAQASTGMQQQHSQQKSQSQPW